MTALMTTEHAGIRQHARRWPTTVRRGGFSLCSVSPS